MAQTGLVKFFNTEKASVSSSLTTVARTFSYISLLYRHRALRASLTIRRFPMRRSRIVAARAKAVNITVTG